MAIQSMTGFARHEGEVRCAPQLVADEVLEVPVEVRRVALELERNGYADFVEAA